jgi:hypothetical protein
MVRKMIRRTEHLWGSVWKPLICPNAIVFAEVIGKTEHLFRSVRADKGARADVRARAEVRARTEVRERADVRGETTHRRRPRRGCA